jgi:hypothetical protein
VPVLVGWTKFERWRKPRDSRLSRTTRTATRCLARGVDNSAPQVLRCGVVLSSLSLRCYRCRNRSNTRLTTPVMAETICCNTGRFVRRRPAIRRRMCCASDFFVRCHGWAVVCYALRGLVNALAEARPTFRDSWSVRSCGIAARHRPDWRPRRRVAVRQATRDDASYGRRLDIAVSAVRARTRRA